jgi:hypothetical protein
MENMEVRDNSPAGVSDDEALWEVELQHPPKSY